MLCGNVDSEVLFIFVYFKFLFIKKQDLTIEETKQFYKSRCDF